MNHSGPLLLALLLALLAAAPADAEALADAYAAAVSDAQVISPGELQVTLLSLAETNATLDWRVVDGDTYVLMANFTKYPASYAGSIGDTLMLVWGKTWVTAARELRQFIAMTSLTPAERPLRLCQLLGLPSTGSYQSLVFMWVRPGDMFRPAYDSSVFNTVIHDTFPAGTDSAYRAWFTANEAASYTGVKPFPWTRLGYTYDWGRAQAPHAGLNEFVVVDSAVVMIDAVEPVTTYLISTDPAAVVVCPNPYVPNDNVRSNGYPYDGSYGSGMSFAPVPHQSIISIFDLQGRRVRTLQPGSVTRCQWDGRNEDGAELASGAYLFRLESPAGTQQNKFVIIR